MTWFKVDDGFSDHPKVKRIPRSHRAAACGLWVLAGSWSARHLTEGRIPAHMIEELGCKRESARQLVVSGLWIVIEDGFIFHDWFQANPSREQVTAERDAAAERQRRARERAVEKRRGSDQQEYEMSRRDSRVTPVDASRVSHVPHVTSTRPDPTRPVREEKTTTSSSSRKRSTTTATRIPEDFAPTPDLLTWAREQAPNAGPRDHEAFMDYWRGKAGAAGRKADWPATWRNWMRKASDDRTGKTTRKSTTDERVAQAQSLIPLAQALDAASSLATVTRLTIEGRTA